MKRGFTLIELLAVIVILAIIALISTPIIIGLIDNARKESFKDGAYGIVKAGELLYSQDLLNGTNEEVTFTYTDGVESSSVGGKELKYNGSKPQNGQVMVNSEGQVAIAIHNGNYCAEKGYTDGEITLSEKDAGECVISGGGSYTDFIVSEGVNKPKLATGMTPIKWNGSAWVNTTEADTDWYNYNSTDKKWANAQTADGSFWVWIPRYIYKISSGWHTNTAGTIDIQFSKDTDDTIDGTVTIVNTGSATDSNNTWTNHPAFTFGTDELTGIWIAKFSASGTTNAVDIKPGVQAYFYVLTNDMFNAARNMETNSRYGWGTSGTNIDTHLIKNIEWGVVTYLTQSTYGKNAEIWVNPSNTFIAGCAGTSVNASSVSGCSHQYSTANGQQASTTGNVYGVYDMSGGTWEHTAAYVNNGNSSLSTYGNSIISAASKYKDVYSITSDSSINNYSNAVNKKGDAIYETSNSYEMNTSWYGDFSYMPSSDFPWFVRSGAFSDAPLTGSFAFGSANGDIDFNGGFRPVLVIGEGL